MIDFPEVKAGQALICGIAIASAASVEPVANQGADDRNVSFSWAAQDKDVMEKTPRELLPEDKKCPCQCDLSSRGRYVERQVYKERGQETNRCLLW